MGNISQLKLSIKLLNSHLILSPAEDQAIDDLPVTRLFVGAHQNLVQTGDHPNRCISIVSGLATTSKTTRAGKRQFAAIHVAGDIPDLMSLHLEKMDCDIRTSTDCEIESVEHEDLRILCARHPRLAFALWKITLSDAAIMREWVINLASRPALARLAHFYCEMFVRLDSAGLVRGPSCKLPLTQDDLSDLIGLSAVHINRTLQVLRSSGFITFNDYQLTILNWKKLVYLANFDDTYLHMRRGSHFASS
ncbi:Crp/Fnr family transcriptional regulator [Brucella sp. 21LCYQ03]|nr:Crp/Fnr family transcriptional regulator [Brucella sp. 21LCYQ03]